jgi:hypothetical protein
MISLDSTTHGTGVLFRIGWIGKRQNASAPRSSSKCGTCQMALLRPAGRRTQFLMTAKPSRGWCTAPSQSQLEPWSEPLIVLLPKNVLKRC